MKTLSFGEILWDVIGDRKYIGGAPFNIAAHLAKMGVESAMLTAVGDDDLGRKALAIAEKSNVNTEYMNVESAYPTGMVDVKITGAGMPSYTINENTAWDNIILTPLSLSKLKKSKWDVLCFGTLAQRTEQNRKTLYEILDKVEFGHIFYDVNLRQKYFGKSWIEKSLEASSIAKFNDEEASVMSDYLFNAKMSERDFSMEVAGKYGVGTICVTRGGNGCAVLHGNEFREFKGIKVKVADTVGAGDSFSAAFLFALMSGRHPFEAATFAGEIGAYVASRNGAVPDYSEEISKSVKAIRNDHFRSPPPA